MSDTCVFCGRTPITREHLWPAWLGRELEIRQRFEHRIEGESDGVETRDVKFARPPFTHVVKAVCANCNGGWMSAIEAHAKPILLDLISAEGRVLDPDDQRTLATWGFLKACVFDELHPKDPVVPVEHRRRLYTYKRPPSPEVAIWLGTYAIEEVGHYAHQGLMVGRDGLQEPLTPNIYIVTITTGALIVQVAGSQVPELSFDDLNLPPELHVAKIWPPSKENVEFAQDHVMDHATLVGFTKMLYNVMGRLTGGAPPAR